MRKFDFWFLFRFIIITGYYCLVNILIMPFFLALDPRFFSFLLLLYLISILVSFVFDKSINLRVKLISDIIFLFLFILTTVILICFDLGDSEAIGFYLILYLPMAICFFVWFIRDNRAIRKFKDRNFFIIKTSENFGLQSKFLFRLFSVSILYFLLNRYFVYGLLLAKNIFWFMLLAYFVVFIVSLFLGKAEVTRLLVVTDIIFLCIFCLQAVCMIFTSYMELFMGVKRLDEPKWYEILTFSPLLVCFVVWFVMDIKTASKNLTDRMTDDVEEPK